MINAFHLKCDEFFFQFNSIQFAVWYWGISLLYVMNFERDSHFFLFQSNETSHDKRLFSSRQRSYFQQQKSISNNDSIVNFLLSTPFHLPTIWAVIHFHLWFHHRHLKSRQMNRLFLLINYIQSIESLGWRREGEKVSDKMKMNEIAFYQKVKLSM